MARPRRQLWLRGSTLRTFAWAIGIAALIAWTIVTVAGAVLTYRPGALVETFLPRVE